MYMYIGIFTTNLLLLGMLPLQHDYCYFRLRDPYISLLATGESWKGPV